VYKVARTQWSQNRTGVRSTAKKLTPLRTLWRVGMRSRQWALTEPEGDLVTIRRSVCAGAPVLASDSELLYFETQLKASRYRRKTHARSSPKKDINY
jgi:hypothetical protein